MNNHLILKLAYAMHKLSFYYCSVLFYTKDNYKKTSKSIIMNFLEFIKVLFKALIKCSKIFNTNSGYYEYIEIPITTKCSMKCKACSNLIPYYQKPCDIDIKTLLDSIDVFINCINNIVYVRVLGGEPLLSNNLYSTISKLLETDKIQRIEIVTNGTIIPKDEELVKILSNNRITISISQYPNVNREPLIAFLKDKKINYRIDKMNFWMEYGNMEKRNKSLKELKKQFKKCNHICKSLLKGNLHMCPRSSHGTDLKIINDNDEDYVNLLDTNITIDEKKKLINELLNKKYIIACDYCDFATNKCKKIPVAEQFLVRPDVASRV